MTASVIPGILPTAVQVVIPALDEEATIGAVIHALWQGGFTRIRVVDNGSADATAEKAREAGADLRVEPIGGYGRACWTGCRQLDPEVEWILFCDADGSDRLDQLDSFLAAARTADFVLGNRRASRDSRSEMTIVQNLGNALSTALIQLGWGYRYRDLGPLRLIRRSLFDRIGMKDRGFGWTLEMQVRAVELGARIVELPVGYRPRQGGRSKISGSIRGSLTAGTIILMTIGRLWLRRNRQRPEKDRIR